jgi:hypothetical protein
MSHLSEKLTVDTDHYLVVIKVRERLRVSKGSVWKFDMQRCNLEMLDDVEVRDQ